MTELKHIKLPLLMDGDTVIVDANNEAIAIVNLAMGAEQRKAISTLIVEAVNQHAALGAMAGELSHSQNRRTGHCEECVANSDPLYGYCGSPECKAHIIEWYTTEGRE